MKDTILEDLQAYEAPKSLPPIAMTAFAVYEAAGFKLDEPGMEVIRQELAGFADDLKALTDAIVGLGAFAIYVRDVRNDMDAAEKVARIIGEHSPKYVPIGERIVNALQDLAVKATDLLDMFSGRDLDVKRRAPKFGEQGPEGTLPLKDLKPVGQPPPVPVRDRNKKPGT